MRWEDERYVKAYTRDTPDWLALGWEAHALFWELLRKSDRAGLLEVGKSGIRGISAVTGIPVDVVERSLKILAQDGCVEQRGCQLLIRNYIEAQNANQSDKARQRNSRETARANAQKVSQNVTSVSDSVTKCDSNEESVTRIASDVTPIPSHPIPSNPNTPMSPRGDVLSLLPDEPEDSPKSAKIREVFAHYRKLHPRAFRNPQPGTKEWRLIRDRMKEGSTAEELCLCIDGYHRSPLHLGQNDRKTKYLDLELFMRDGSHVTKGIELATSETKKEPRWGGSEKLVF
jgi:hypothetical protein